MERYPVRQSGPFKSFEYQILEFIVHFKGVEMPPFRKSRGKTDGRISGKGPELKNSCRADHPDHHRKETSQDSTRQHPGMVGPDIGLTLHPVESLPLRSAVLLDITV